MQAPRDQNFIPAVLLESSTNPGTVITAKGDELTGRLLVDIPGVVIGPAGAVSGNVALFDGATGKLIKDSGLFVDTTAKTLTLTSLSIRDTSATYDVTLAATSSTTISAGRKLTFDIVNADRTLKISGNATVSQDYSITGTPTFANIILSPTASSYKTVTGIDESGPAVFINRVITTEATGNEHGIIDYSDFSRSTKAYASYDCQTRLTGTNSYDHFVGFQNRGDMSSSGTLTNYYSFLSTPKNIGAGTITTLYHFTNNDSTYTPTATYNTEYGLYIKALRGTTKYGVYIASDQSFFGGSVGIGATPSYKLHVEAATPRVYVKDTGTGYSLLQLSNNTTSFYIGQEQAAGGAILTGSSAYAGVINVGGAYPLQLGTSGTIRMTMAATGQVSIPTRVTTGSVDRQLLIETGLDKAVASNLSSYLIGVQAQMTLCNIANTYTDSGYRRPFYLDASINDTNFAGTLAEQSCFAVDYGIYACSAGAGAKTITNAYGVLINPYYKAGTVTNGYGLYITAPVTGGTITNSWAIYSANAALSYFTGGISSLGMYSTTVGATNRDVYVDNTGVIGYVSSSIRYKENVKELDSSRIYDLNPVSYTYKSDKTKSEQYGLIVEEVEKVMPELVSYDKEGEPETVSYNKLIPLLLNEVKSLNERIKILENK